MDSRELPEPGPEHRIRFENEFVAQRESQTDWAAYLRIENLLAAELASKVLSDRESGNPVDRYRISSGWLISIADFMLSIGQHNRHRLAGPHGDEGLS